MLVNQIAQKIDHTLLKAEATSEMIQKLCAEADRYGFYSVCVNSFWIPLAKEALSDSTTKTCSVVGFPLSAQLFSVKLREIEQLLLHRVDEIDLVMNIGAFKSGQHETVFDEIKNAVNLCDTIPLKVIVETALLSRDEKIRACELVMATGAAFIKTSTGFSTGGATVEDIKLFREIAGNTLKIKASGGIRNRETALAMIGAGADRLGTSQSVDIVSGTGDSSKQGGY